MNAMPPTTISSFLIETMMVSQGVNFVLSVNMIQNYVFHPITFSRIHRIISQRLARRGWRWRWWAGMTRSLFTWVTSDKAWGKRSTFDDIDRTQSSKHGGAAKSSECHPGRFPSSLRSYSTRFGLLASSTDLVPTVLWVPSGYPIWHFVGWVIPLFV